MSTPETGDTSRAENDAHAAVAFAARGPAPVALRIPLPAILAVAIAIAGGAVRGMLMTGSTGERIAHTIFYAASFAYLTTSLIDLLEHLRLERLTTGRWWSMTVVPLGETLNHLATIAVLATFLTLARPPPSPLEWRDYLVLIAPFLFLALGWRDELVYHRRRSTHREDSIHTVSHLAAGVMLASCIAARMVRW
jgi:hypothetical protein